MNIANYTAVAGPGINSSAALKPDDTGYVKVILGGFNVLNSAGQYYPLTDTVKSIFDNSSVFQRRVASGYLCAENGHPDIVGLPEARQVQRILTIKEDNVCSHIRKVSLEAAKDEFGKDIVLQYGWIKPSGAKGYVVEEMLKNPLENLAYSIRAFVDMQRINGVLHKFVKSIVNWDRVIEPGIKQANSFTTAKYTLEDLMQMVYSEETFTIALDDLSQFALESAEPNFKMVKDSMGWHKVKTVDTSVLVW